jgi:hypothetical protein
MAAGMADEKLPRDNSEDRSRPILLKNSLIVTGGKILPLWKALNFRERRGQPLLTISGLKFAQCATPRVFRRFSAAFQFNSKIASTLETSFSTE